MVVVLESLFNSINLAYLLKFMLWMYGSLRTGEMWCRILSAALAVLIQDRVLLIYISTRLLVTTFFQGPYN